jgi:homocysteine S-methyltransferase
MDLLGELGKRVVCGDGALGTLLLSGGVPVERCLEELCLSAPERIQKIHEEYVGAGATVIETNSLGANAVRLGRVGLEKEVREINRAAVELARAGVGEHEGYVAGSVGPVGIAAAEADAAGIDRQGCFREQISALVDAGADLVFLETFTEFAEMELALRAKQEVTDVPVICSFACPADGKLRCGTPLKEAFARLRDGGGTLMGVNCLNDPQQMISLLESLQADYFLAVYPAAGQPRHTATGFAYDVTPESFAASVAGLAANGARLIGGCCGTTPAHVAALARAVRNCPAA